jgi:phosphatidylglycerophosphatase A
MLAGLSNSELVIAILVALLVVSLLRAGIRKWGQLKAGVRTGMDAFIKASGEAAGELGPRQSEPVAQALSHDSRPCESPSPRTQDFAAGIIVWVAQGFGVGRIPFAPGTWGSLLGIGWAWLLLWPGSLGFYALGIIAGCLAAVELCGAAERILGQHDPGSVVLDEIVAVPLALGGCVGLWWWQAGELPHPARLSQWWPAAAGAFALFRLFDIWKPWPIRRLQSLPGGWGVVADDLAAGLAAAIVLWAGTQAAFVVQLIRG